MFFISPSFSYCSFDPTYFLVFLFHLLLHHLFLFPLFHCLIFLLLSLPSPPFFFSSPSSTYLLAGIGFIVLSVAVRVLTAVALGLFESETIVIWGNQSSDIAEVVQNRSANL